MWSVLRETMHQFQKDECPRMAAALAFYTVFSLPGIVIAVVTLVGYLVEPVLHEEHGQGAVRSGREVARQRLKAYLEETMSNDVADQVDGLASQVDQVLQEPRSVGSAAIWLGGAAMLLFGASGALTEVQAALNRAWGVIPDPQQSAWRYFLIKRLFSLAMLLGIAFLLLVSLVVSWGLAEFHQWIDAYAPSWISSRVMGVVNLIVSFGIITLLFAAILRFVPDVKLAWRDVAAGAVVTALLFVLGKTVVGIYLAWSHPGSAYGAAGSVALVLMWIYYSSLILFLGAEFTHVLAAHRGRLPQPQEGAVQAAYIGEATTGEREA